MIPPILALALLAPATAAASPAALIRDCLQNGKITGHYSQQDYARAHASLPTDVAEYSDCAAVIRRAELAAAAGQPTPGSTSPVSPRVDPLIGASPAQRANVAHAQQGGAAPFNFGGQLVRPGVVAVRAGSIFTVLPTPLIVALGALLSIALATLGRLTRDLVRARRSR